MANMDIAEKRLPQDGRISIKIKGEEIDVRRFNNANRLWSARKSASF